MTDLAKQITTIWPHALDAHPVIELVQPEDLAAAGVDLAGYYRPRHEAILRQWGDPLRHGYRPPCWRKVDAVLEEMRRKWPIGTLSVLISGGIRSSKSYYAGQRVMRELTAGPKKWALCFSETEGTSWVTNQPIMYEFFPREYKPQEGKRSVKGGLNVSWHGKTGFGGNAFTLPGGSRCDFRFYESKVQTIEGTKPDIVWADELIPLEFIEPLHRRLGQRNGIFLITFTPMKGYSPAYASFVDGATAVEEMDLEIPVMDDEGNFERWDKVPVRDHAGQVVGVEKVPVVLACRKPAASVVFFDTRKNFYGPPDGVIANVGRTPKEKLLAEAKLCLYGIPKSAAAAKFPWDDAAHIVEPEVVERLLADRSQFTLVHILDPAPGRNMFMQWWADLPNGQMVCVREWPQEGDYIPNVGDPGPWAVSGALGDDGAPGGRRKRELADGARGPAQERFGLNLKQMSREIERVEIELGKFSGGGRLQPFERNVDSRAGGAATVRADQYLTLIDEWMQLDEGCGLHFYAAPGGQTATTGEDWITFITELMYVDPTIGAPRLLVNRKCTNTIWALKHWTGRDGPGGACKDPVDCTKYKALRPVRYVNFSELKSRGSRGGSY